MTDIGSFLNRNCELLASHAGVIGTDEIMLFPAGSFEVFGDEDMVMDAVAAKAVIDGFNDRGVKVPVDYEHSTLYKAGKGESSPAAGWITAMTWNPSVGLVATVEWGDEARRQIKAKEYKYLSPHFRIDNDTRRVDHVLAVALTNTPRINNMRELVAASLAAAEYGTSDGGNTMLKKNRIKLCSVLELKDDALDDEIVAAVEEAMEAPAEPTPEEPDPKKVATETLMLLRDAMVSAGVVGVEASLQEAVEAAVALVGTSNEDTEEAAASIASALGMPKDKKHTTAEIVASITTKIASTVPADRLKKAEEELASLTAEKQARETTEIVGSLVSAGKINPHDEKEMEWARTQAKDNRVQFCSLMENAPVKYNSDQQTPNDASPSGRDTVIASLVDSHKVDGCGAGVKWYVNAGLNEQGLDAMNEDEIKKHSLA